MVYANQIPSLTHEESLIGAMRVAFGSGTLSSADHARIRRLWMSGAAPETRSPPATQEEGLLRLRALGFTVEEAPGK